MKYDLLTREPEKASELMQDGVVRHREVLEDARNEPDYERVFSSLHALTA